MLTDVELIRKYQRLLAAKNRPGAEGQTATAELRALMVESGDRLMGLAAQSETLTAAERVRKGGKLLIDVASTIVDVAAEFGLLTGSGEDEDDDDDALYIPDEDLLSETSELATFASSHAGDDVEITIRLSRDALEQAAFDPECAHALVYLAAVQAEVVDPEEGRE